MKKIKNSAFASLIFTVLIIACQKSETEIKYIDEIINNKIVYVDGSELALAPREGEQLFYLIRHAEKDTTVQENPGLTEQGLNRATRLADIFRKTRIDAVYSTIYLRTLLTVDSLVKSKGMSILPYDPGKLPEFADSLQLNNKIRTALIVGHSNTTPELAKSLTDSHEDLVINDDEYETMYLVWKKNDNSKELIKLKFSYQ